MGSAYVPTPVAPVVLTSGATVASDCGGQAFRNFRLTIGQALTLSNPSNPVDGGVYNYVLEWGGAFALTLGSKFKVNAISNATANTAVVLSVIYDAAKDAFIGSASSAQAV